MNLIKKYWFVLVLVLILVILVFLKTKYSSTDIDVGITKNQTNEITDTISGTEAVKINTSPAIKEQNNLTPAETVSGTENLKEEAESDNLSDEVNVDSLEPFFPYQGTYFKVKRYLDSGFLEIIVSKEDNLSKAKEEVEKWLEDHGTNSQETQLIYVFGN